MPDEKPGQGKKPDQGKKPEQGKKPDRKKEPGQQEERRGRGAMKPKDDITFGEKEIDILNEVLNIVPELKVCAWAVRQHRNKGVGFPIADYDSLFKLMDGEEIAIANHHITRKLMNRYVHPGLFPIQDEPTLMRVVYLALGACNTDLAWALQAPPHAEELLQDVRTAMQKEVV